MEEFVKRAYVYGARKALVDFYKQAGRKPTEKNFQKTAASVSNYYDAITKEAK